MIICLQGFALLLDYKGALRHAKPLSKFTEFTWLPSAATPAAAAPVKVNTAL